MHALEGARNWKSAQFDQMIPASAISSRAPLTLSLTLASDAMRARTAAVSLSPPPSAAEASLRAASLASAGEQIQGMAYRPNVMPVCRPNLEMR